MGNIDKRKNFLLEKVARKGQLMRYEVEERTAKPLISLHLITKDIAEMLVCIESAIILGNARPANLLLITALWEKMIIAYGKIFMPSDDGFSNLEYTNYFKDGSAIALHQEIMETRNSYLAHRGNNNYEYQILLCDIIGTEDNCHVEFSVPSYKKMGHYHNPVVVRRHLKKLFKAVNGNLQLKVQKLELNLYPQMGLEPNLP